MAEVFIPKEVEKILGMDIKSLYGYQSIKGDIGLELEFEGEKLPKSNSELGPWWQYHEDHSLRGHDNAEYVLRKPIAFDDVPPALEHLWQVFEEYNSSFDESNRTSVHVHLNVLDFHMNRLASFIALYVIVEEILTEWCGDHRVGNLFCLRVKDAPAIMKRMKEYIQFDGRNEISDNLHYAAMNLNAVQKFGSLEFRTLRGVDNPETVQQWVNILRRLYELSSEYKDPREIIWSFSGNGPVSFFELVLGEHAETLVKDTGWTLEQVKTSTYEGVRHAQDLCFCRDWSVFEALEVKKDPFGRSSKKVAQNLMQAAQAATEPALPPENPFEAFVQSVQPYHTQPVFVGTGISAPAQTLEVSDNGWFFPEGPDDED